MGEASLEVKEEINPMRKIRVEKVVVNCCVGESGPKLEKALRIIENLTGQKPQVRNARKTIKGFGIHKGEPIAIRVTLRKQRAVGFLEKALKAVNNRLKETSFDSNGNVSFGIAEHLDIPGVKYDPELGIIGMDVCIHLSRPGLRIKLRRRARSNIGSSHKIKPEEAMEYLKRAFGITIVREEL